MLHRLLLKKSNQYLAAAFKAWSPGDNEVICAKPELYYQMQCFDEYVGEKYENVRKKFRGAKRLQGGLDCFGSVTLINNSIKLEMCFILIRTIGHCLQWFNEKCSKDFLQTGQGDFTAATTCKTLTMGMPMG